MAGGVYHFISRFTDKSWFIESQTERRAYLRVLGDAMTHTDWRCFAFAVMSSHIHLGLISGTSTLASWLRPMHTAFAIWINARRDRIGAVFVKKPKLVAIWPNGTTQLIHYIHNNPVRAGVVTSAAHSDWTSHRAYQDGNHRPKWLDVGSGCALSGFDAAPSLARWIEANTVDRQMLDGVRVVPRPKIGRPRKDRPHTTLPER